MDDTQTKAMIQSRAVLWLLSALVAYVIKIFGLSLMAKS